MISGQDARTTRNFWVFFKLEVPNVKSIARPGMNSQSHSKSCLLMTKNSHKSSVYFSKLWLLARKFISGRVWKPTDKAFLT
jgi:hypothetical protein